MIQILSAQCSYDGALVGEKKREKNEERERKMKAIDFGKIGFCVQSKTGAILNLFS